MTKTADTYKLLSEINKRIETLNSYKKEEYLQAAVELERLKALLTNGQFDLRIWE